MRAFQQLLRMEAALNESAWRRQAPDLSGRWERDSTQNVDECIAFLKAHGHDQATAEAKASGFTGPCPRPHFQGAGQAMHSRAGSPRPLTASRPGVFSPV